MQKVQLKPIQIKGEWRVGIYYANNQLVNQSLKKTFTAQWSSTLGCWHVKDEKKVKEQLLQFFKSKNYEIDAVQKEAPIKPFFPTIQLERKISINNQGIEGYSDFQKIMHVNLHVVEKMKDHLILKAYSQSTIKTYLNEIHQFLYSLGEIPADDLHPDHLKKYLVYCLEKLKLSENTLHSRINSLKFYYEQVLQREKFFWEIPRPKKPLQLPKILNEDELGRLFNALSNKKHKAMLFTVYSAGLRVSEIVHLKIKDIDSERMQIFIEQAK